MVPAATRWVSTTCSTATRRYSSGSPTHTPSMTITINRSWAKRLSSTSCLAPPTPSSGKRSRALPNRRHPVSPIPTRSHRQMCLSKVTKHGPTALNLTQPGIPAIVNYLASLPWKPPPNRESCNCYMINNLSPGFLPNGDIDAASILTGSKVPPSGLRTIGDALNEKKISWAYYGGGYNAAVRVANGSPDPVDKLIANNYCDICNPFSYASSIMGNTTQRAAHIKDATDFFHALDNGEL